MKVSKYESREAWFEARRGKITGSSLKDIVTLRGTGKKIGYYELIAARLASPADNEDPMERGTRLEPEAIALYEKQCDLPEGALDTSLVLWQRDDNDSIALSPDAFIGNTKAFEVKCLSSARHIEALLTQEIPDEYQWQKLQYFIVNDELEELTFLFYDPRLAVKQLHTITIKRADVQEDVDKYLAYQKATLQEIDDIVNQLTF